MIWFVRREERHRLLSKITLRFKPICLDSGPDYVDTLLRFEDEIDKGQIRSSHKICIEFMNQLTEGWRAEIAAEFRYGPNIELRQLYVDCERDQNNGRNWEELYRKIRSYLCVRVQVDDDFGHEAARTAWRAFTFHHPALYGSISNCIQQCNVH